MTRTTAREIAIQLGFAAALRKMEPSELMDDFFAPEHYASLQEEDELYKERPDKKQMAYIRRLVQLTLKTAARSTGISNATPRAGSWSASPALPLPSCAVPSARYFIWTRYPMPPQ